MGSSLAIRIRNEDIATKIIGVDTNPEHISIALAQKIIYCSMSLTDAIAASDVIIIAIPVDATIEILPTILQQVNDQIVFDLGSTKATIIAKINDHPKRGRFVGTHPMWGTEKMGHWQPCMMLSKIVRWSYAIKVIQILMHLIGYEICMKKLECVLFI